MSDLEYTEAAHRLFMSSVEDVLFRHLIFGIKEIREYQPMRSGKWIARKDIVLKDGRRISVRVVVENGCFFIQEKGLKEESGYYVDSSGRTGRERKEHGGSGGSEGSGSGFH